MQPGQCRTIRTFAESSFGFKSRNEGFRIFRGLGLGAFRGLELGALVVRVLHFGVLPLGTQSQRAWRLIRLVQGVARAIPKRVLLITATFSHRRMPTNPNRPNPYNTSLVARVSRRELIVSPCLFCSRQIAGQQHSTSQEAKVTAPSAVLQMR